jgi:hypothetical protein
MPTVNMPFALVSGALMKTPYVSKEIVFTDMCDFGGPVEAAASL